MLKLIVCEDFETGTSVPTVNVPLPVKSLWYEDPSFK